MADLHTIAALVAVSMAVSGCGLDALEGKPSAFQLHHERLAALEAKVATYESQPAREAAPAPAPEPIVFEPPPEPECIPVFRVVECP